MAYQQSPKTVTVTASGDPVEWLVDYDRKTVTPVVAGVELGEWRNREAAKKALGLVDVPARKVK